MEGREKAHTDKYRENLNDWNYNKSSMFTSLQGFGPIKFLVNNFVAQSAPMSLTNLLHESSTMKMGQHVPPQCKTYGLTLQKIIIFKSSIVRTSNLIHGTLGAASILIYTSQCNGQSLQGKNIVVYIPNPKFLLTTDTVQPIYT